MQRVIRTDGWTADWRLSSALWETYSVTFGGQPGEGRRLVFERPIVILCAGLPSDPVGTRIADVADELKPYYPVVEGGADAPLAPGAVVERVAAYRRPGAAETARAALFGAGGATGGTGRGPNGFEAARSVFAAVVAGTEARPGEPCRVLVNSLVVSEEDDETDPAAHPEQTGFSVVGDVDVDISFSLKDAPDDVAVDRVVDGFLRFFFKIGHDHTRFRRRR